MKAFILLSLLLTLPMSKASENQLLPQFEEDHISFEVVGCECRLEHKETSEPCFFSEKHSASLSIVIERNSERCNNEVETENILFQTDFSQFCINTETPEENSLVSLNPRRSIVIFEHSDGLSSLSQSFHFLNSDSGVFQQIMKKEETDAGVAIGVMTCRFERNH